MIDTPHRVKVREVMTEQPIVIDIDKTVQEAAILMRRNNISGLVVVNGKAAVAFVTLKDIAKKVVAEDLSSKEVHVRDVMSQDMITCDVDDTLADISTKMVANNVSRIPVLDSDRNLIGIVTKTDMLEEMPGIINVFYEKDSAIGPSEKCEVQSLDGICEECGNHSDELKQYDSKWLCQECLELKNAEQ